MSENLEPQIETEQNDVIQNDVIQNITVQPIKTEYVVKELNSWEDLEAKTPLLRGIYAYGFEIPSPIQRKAICPIFDKKDVIAQAQSGTGKTACFTIGALQLIDTARRVPQAILLSPTRELAIQTKLVVDKIGSMFSKLQTQLVERDTLCR